MLLTSNIFVSYYLSPEVEGSLYKYFRDYSKKLVGRGEASEYTE